MLIFGLTACTATPTITEVFDDETGVTISFSQPPLVFSRDTPGYGAYSRNFVQMGAIEVNRSGTLHYYLWLGVWNTVQSSSAVEYRNGFESVVVFADGEPLLLDVRGWTPESIGVSNSVYSKPVASSVDGYFPVSLDQVRLIAGAQDIRLEAVSSSLKKFELWDEQEAGRKGLSVFVDRVSH